MIHSDPVDAVVFHSQIASEFHESYRTDPNRLERLELWRRYLTHYARKTERAYDLGCGSGMLTLEIAPLANQVVAIDGADRMLDLARKNIAERGYQNVAFINSRLPIEDTSMLEPAELVISSSVIEYLDSVEEALAFAHKLLTPRGLLLFSISNRDSLSRKLVRTVHRLTGRPRYIGFIRHFVNERDILRPLKTTGFEYITHTYFGGQDRLNQLLARFFPARFASNMILIVARRAT
jgi:SAM-dependent methyltransferase